MKITRSNSILIVITFVIFSMVWIGFQSRVIKSDMKEHAQVTIQGPILFVNFVSKQTHKNLFLVPSTVKVSGLRVSGIDNNEVPLLWANTLLEISPIKEFQSNSATISLPNGNNFGESKLGYKFSLPTDCAEALQETRAGRISVLVEYDLTEDPNNTDPLSLNSFSQYWDIPF